MNDFEVGKPKEKSGSQEYTFELCELYDRFHAENMTIFLADLLCQKRDEIILEEMARMGFDWDFIWKNGKDFKRIVFQEADAEAFTYKGRLILEIFWEILWSDEKNLLQNMRSIKLNFKTRTYGWGKE